MEPHYIQVLQGRIKNCTQPIADADANAAPVVDNDAFLPFIFNAMLHWLSLLL